MIRKEFCSAVATCSSFGLGMVLIPQRVRSKCGQSAYGSEILGTKVRNRVFLEGHSALCSINHSDCGGSLP